MALDVADESGSLLRLEDASEEVARLLEVAVRVARLEPADESGDSELGLSRLEVVLEVVERRRVVARLAAWKIYRRRSIISANLGRARGQQHYALSRLRKYN